MNRVLEAIAAERSELTGRLAALEEMERICIAAVEQAFVAKLEAKAPPKPRAKRREPIRALPPARRSQPQPRQAQATPSEMKQRAQQVLADTGAWDREHVADACGYLLNDGLIVLNPDGTYRPMMLGLEAE